MKIKKFLQSFIKNDLPDFRVGDTVRVYQKIPTSSKDLADKKEKLQIFEGLIIARKHGKEAGATITIRKVISGVGVERIIPIHSPLVEKIEVLKRGKVRRAKLYYLRKAKGKRAKLKRKEIEVAEAQSDLQEINKTAEELSQNEKTA